MHSRVLQKADGRALRLYSRAPITSDMKAPSPFADALHANPHMRWHPLRGEWITYAGYRQTRTFLPPPEYNPLAVTQSADNPTELPPGDWQVAVFDNRFPSLSLQAHDAPDLIVPTEPAIGKCEVVVYTQDANASLGALPLPHIELLLEVWAERTEQLEAGLARPDHGDGVDRAVEHTVDEALAPHRMAQESQDDVGRNGPEEAHDQLDAAGFF